jgi:hypothetical protein
VFQILTKSKNLAVILSISEESTVFLFKLKKIKRGDSSDESP